MAFLDGINIEDLRIDKFIFHVVHHGDQEPILLNETPIGKFEDFFLNRVRDTIKGNRFTFIGGSQTFLNLQQVSDSKEKFIDISHKLAIDFHTRQNKTIKPGVMMFMILTDGNEDLYSIIKYDHEQVLTYELDGDRKAILQEVKNSFTKTKEALHKSALIRLSADNGEIIVIDQKVSHGITDFFKGFLNIKRKYNNGQMTKAVHEAAVETVYDHKDDLPPELKNQFAARVLENIQKTKIFNMDSFFLTAFGPHGTDDIKKTFLKKLEKRDIINEIFEFDSTGIKPQKIKRIKTREGVDLKYPSTASDTIKVEYGTQGEKTKIIITTDEATEF